MTAVLARQTRMGRATTGRKPARLLAWKMLKVAPGAKARLERLGKNMLLTIGIGVFFLVMYVALGVKFVRPTSRGLVERFGKYKRLAMPGLNWIIPGIDRLILVNITEVMVNAEPQEIITSDKLNARVDAQVYFKVKSDEESVKNSQYAVFDYQYQMVNLARTTLRNIIGTLTLKSANSERGKINSELQRTMREETNHWGIDIVRTELKEIDPPSDVQVTMNKVVKAENEKVAAIDFATATETMADGARRAEIKRAEGIRQAKILEAEGEAQAIQLVNQAADKYFVGNAQLLRRLITVETSLASNTKIVVPMNTELVNIIGEMAGIVPLPSHGGTAERPYVTLPLRSGSPERTVKGNGS
jgi:regulator of protease activity HflC (stomatin/prohibitin superfamily)